MLPRTVLEKSMTQATHAASWHFLLPVILTQPIGGCNHDRVGY